MIFFSKDSANPIDQGIRLIKKQFEIKKNVKK